MLQKQPQVFFSWAVMPKAKHRKEESQHIIGQLNLKGRSGIKSNSQAGMWIQSLSQTQTSRNLIMQEDLIYRIGTKTRRQLLFQYWVTAKGEIIFQFTISYADPALGLSQLSSKPIKESSLWISISSLSSSQGCFVFIRFYTSRGLCQLLRL